MTTDDLVQYVQDAVHRLSSDLASSRHGSHAAGIYNKAANRFEKRFQGFTSHATRRSGLEKRTLGALIELLEKLPNARVDPLRRVIDGAMEVNAPWKRIKHGEDPPLSELLHGLQRMLDVLSAIAA